MQLDKSFSPLTAPQGAAFQPMLSMLWLRRFLLLFALYLVSVNANAFELYKTFQTPELFLQEAFDGSPPEASVLYLKDTDQRAISAVFQRSFPQQRLRYWQKDGRSAWIFDDIGKEGYVPTTCGFIVSDGAVEQAKVLVYRESRGEQVAEPSFLQQLMGGRAAGATLDREVDNITGATLSVQMMVRMARTALELDRISKVSNDAGVN